MDPNLSNFFVITYSNGAMTFSITSFSIMALGIEELFAAISINDTQQR
jgi:hypothetical protein